MKKAKPQSDDNFYAHMDATSLDGTIFELLIRLAKKYPNDADLGGKIREHIINSNQPA